MVHANEACEQNEWPVMKTGPLTRSPAKQSPWQRVVRCRLNRQPFARRSSKKSHDFAAGQDVHTNEAEKARRPTLRRFGSVAV